MYNKDYKETRAALLKVFKELRKDHDVVARANFSCCMSCASYELSEIVDERGAAGAVYWHRQDDDGFKECGELQLRYFTRTESQDSAKLGQLVQNLLGKYEVPSSWDGDPNRTITVFCHGGF